MAEEEGDRGRVVVLVCVECGKEYTYEDEEPPADLTCEKCGNEVFRSFYDSAGEREEAEDEFRTETERDVSTRGGAADVTRTDILDIDNP